MKKRVREGDIYDPCSLLNTSEILILKTILCTTLFSFFYCWGNGGTEKLSHLPKVTQLVRGLSRMCSYTLLNIIILLNNKNVVFLEFSWLSFALICWERTFLASYSYLPLTATFGKFCSIWHLSPMPIHYTQYLLYPTYMLDPLYISALQNSLNSITWPLEVHLNGLFPQTTSKADFFFQVDHMLTAHLWVLVNRNHYLGKVATS